MREALPWGPTSAAWLLGLHDQAAERWLAACWPPAVRPPLQQHQRLAGLPACLLAGWLL